MTAPFRDPTLEPQVRVDDLLSRMTLREKIGQLNQRLLGWNVWTRDGGGFSTTHVLDAETAHWGGIGAIYGLQRADAWSGRDLTTGVDAHRAHDLAAMVQERVITGSRLGIPALFVEEAPHGHQAVGAQLWPVNIAIGATWRPELLEEAAAHTAAELRARGAHLALASGLDMLRDPRWGRSEECFAEDPLLAARMVSALVRGLHSQIGLGAVLKHFAGQGSAIGGRNTSGAPIGPRELAEVHLPAARAGIAEGAIGVMAAYNDIDGVPCHANEDLLTGLLRDTWQFEGIVMSDAYAIDRLKHGAGSPEAAAARALHAGVDLSMFDDSYTAIEGAVAQDLVSEAVVDRACHRVLTVKVRLGLLDPPAPPPSFPPPAPVRDLVAATAVLLQNRGELLPLPDTATRVAVIGPNADNLPCLLGDYVPPLPPGSGTTVLQALNALPGHSVTHEPGSGLTTPIPGGTTRAAEAATGADVAVLVLGSSSERRYGDEFQMNGAAQLGGSTPVATTGEGFDVADVRLPRAQRELVAAVTATGTPTVAVIVSGRPHAIADVTAACDAVLYAWYSGPTGGTAIAELLCGRSEPTGRLPASLPRSTATLPVAYNERHETTKRYVDTEAAAALPFGFGLDYTTWRLGTSTVSADAVAATDVPGLTVTADLTNTGRRPGTQTVQLYAQALVPGLVPRRAVLVGFTRIHAAPGQTHQVTLPVDRNAEATLGLPVKHPTQLLLWLSLNGPQEPHTPHTVLIEP
ncbi:glycoside hydrolase family 3 N-terminal domain-containing protein [Streptomyces sp. NPDC004752]